MLITDRYSLLDFGKLLEKFDKWILVNIIKLLVCINAPYKYSITNPTLNLLHIQHST